MTAPATKQRWYRSVYATFNEGLDKPPTIATAYAAGPVSMSGKAPAIARPKTDAPPLPPGCRITCEERVLIWDRDSDLQPNEIAAARHWLGWRWIHGYKVPAE